MKKPPISHQLRLVRQHSAPRGARGVPIRHPLGTPPSRPQEQQLEHTAQGAQVLQTQGLRSELEPCTAAATAGLCAQRVPDSMVHCNVVRMPRDTSSIECEHLRT
eukprot:TRINITY_DN4411_c0_g1_i7.p3 TRINITY_DN4411_c0_g1~~TRINITY_DN4411_c0_g1_i7.p3  ORF type:complete len:105 (+),score=12.72 TRINITY_DN4411_c0_g1_i7:231-545(+)